MSRVQRVPTTATSAPLEEEQSATRDVATRTTSLMTTHKLVLVNIAASCFVVPVVARKGN